MFGKSVLRITCVGPASGRHLGFEKRPNSERNWRWEGFSRNPDVDKNCHCPRSLGRAFLPPCSGYRETRDLRLGTNLSLIPVECCNTGSGNERSHIIEQSQRSIKRTPIVFGPVDGRLLLFQYYSSSRRFPQTCSTSHSRGAGFGKAPGL